MPDRASAAVVHVVQDVPTPHNNTLLAALRDTPGVELRVWYAQLSLPQYSFSESLGAAVVPPIVYGARRPSWRLLRAILKSPRDKWLIVGWINPTTRLLIPLLWITRRPYNMWFDLPVDARGGVRGLVRSLYYFFLRTSRARIFAAGQNAVDYFCRRGFAAARVCDLPIFVELGPSIDGYRTRRAEIRRKFRAGDDDLLVSAGSRLVHAKGFDLLIRAVARLEDTVGTHIRVLIVGKGPERPALETLIRELGLQEQVFIEEWMENAELREHIASSDVLVHPARFDAFGGATLTAMAVGVPVIGSVEAGSTADRVEHGVNGWLYAAEDVDSLTGLLTRAWESRADLPTMGRRARETAERFTPSHGARILLERAL